MELNPHVNLKTNYASISSLGGICWRHQYPACLRHFAMRARTKKLIEGSLELSDVVLILWLMTGRTFLEDLLIDWLRFRQAKSTSAKA
jgi:hypothetical protein